MTWDLSFRNGTGVDVTLFSHQHYIGRDPFPPERVIVAREGGRDVGVLAVSRPAINGSWRRELPGFAARASHGRWLNETLRTISRVIVAPEYRGLGVATALVREYLRAPLTPVTEAIAAMGHVSPFFERAGMRALGEISSARDARLKRELAALGVTPLGLLRTAATPVLLARSRGLCDALLRWANDSRATRGLRAAPGGSLAAIASLAARRVVCPPRVYVSVEGESVAARGAA